MFTERSTTLSPRSAEIGMNVRSVMSRRVAQSVVVDEVHLVHAQHQVRDPQE
jgi:hypothetical protein